MNEVDKERLRLNLTSLEADLNVKEMLSYLHEEGIMTGDVWEEIEAIQPQTRLNRTRELLRRLPHLGPKAYSVFRQALDKYGYEHLSKMLDATEVVIVRKEEWLENLPDEVRNSKPTPKELSAISKELGQNWENIAYSLGLEKKHIDHLRMDPSSLQSPATLIFNMLNKWKGIKGKNATWEFLVKALIDNDVAVHVYQTILQGKS